MKQIRHRMMQQDGGVSTVTWVKDSSGQPMAIPLVEGSQAGAPLDGVVAQPTNTVGVLNGLAPDRRLTAHRNAAAGAAGKARVKTPTKQLHKVEEQKTW